MHVKELECATFNAYQLVREFYGNLKVVQDEDSGIILQSTVQRNIIQFDPQVISRIIGVPMLSISANPFNEVLEPLTLDQLRDFFYAHPQGEERAHAHIKIGAFSPLHHLLTKIILHNL